MHLNTSVQTPKLGRLGRLVSATYWLPIKLSLSFLIWKLRMNNSCPAHFTVLAAQSCPTLCDPTKILCLWNFPGKNSGTGCHCLLQRIFPTHGSNPCLFHLLHWQPDSLRLCHLRSPFSISTALLFEEYYTSELFHSAYFSGDSYKLLLVSIIYSLLLSSIAQYDFIRCLPIHSLMNT